MSNAWFASRSGEVTSGAFGLLGGLSVTAYNQRAVKRVQETFFKHVTSTPHGHLPPQRRLVVAESLAFTVTPLASVETPGPTKFHVAVVNTALAEGKHNRTAEFLYDQRTQKLVFQSLPN